MLSSKSDQFLFVSAIANRLGYFNMEAAPRNYAQDFAVAHNAAVALAWLLPSLLPKEERNDQSVPENASVVLGPEVSPSRMDNG